MKSGHQFPRVERMIEKITIDGNVAIVMGKELQQPSLKVTHLNDWFPRIFTNIWLKKGKRGQLAGRQSTEINDK